MGTSLARHLCIVMVAGLLLGASGSLNTSYVLLDGSQFWIDGSSTVNDFTCAAANIEGRGLVTRERVLATVAVPVRTFDCGVRAMNRDFYRALRSSEHPEIHFTLNGAEVLAESAASGEWTPLRAFGTLQLAGASRSITIAAEGRELGDGSVQIRGSHDLRMSHFEVEPPTAMLGLVRAHDEITVRFDLRAERR
jgi:hypothetical protein